MTELETHESDDAEQPQDEPHVQTPDEETEEPEEQEADEAAEADTPPEASQNVGEISEKTAKKITASFNTYTAAVERNLEQRFLDLVACPLCYSGMHPGYINKGDVGRIPEEVKSNTLFVLGFAREKNYRPDPDLIECPTCGGEGKTERPSKVAGKETRQCPTCKGQGDLTREGTTLAAATNGHSEEHFTLAESASSDAPERDNWGEPRVLPDGRENPNYGKQPQYKVLVEPWGMTVNLGVQDAPAGG